MRDKHPSWGSRKLAIVLHKRFGERAPSERTITRLLTRFERIRRRRRPRGRNVVELAPDVRAEASNDVWTVDFKGWWRTRDGHRCEPLTACDAFSRYVIAVELPDCGKIDDVRPIFERLFRRYGVPRAIQRDNGTPFIAVSSRAGLTRHSAWGVSLGIRIVRSRVANRQDNGGHERMHRDLAIDIQSVPAAANRGARKSRLSQAATHLLVMAQDNPSWGYTKLRGALYALGFDISRTTIARVLAEHGIAPAPTRKDAHPWRTFLKAHLAAIAAADFFTVEVLTLRGLVRYFVWFVIDVKTRAVTIAQVTATPRGEAMVNTARRMIDDLDGALRGMKYLIVDRDPLYTREFREMLRRGGVELVRLPARSPNLNAYAERFVRSIKSELLSKVVPLGEGHLRHLLREYVPHYHHERPHQGVGNLMLMPRRQPPWEAEGRVRRRQRVGGILNFYERRAA